MTITLTKKCKVSQVWAGVCGAQVCCVFAQLFLLSYGKTKPGQEAKAQISDALFTFPIDANPQNVLAAFRSGRLQAWVARRPSSFVCRAHRGTHPHERPMCSREFPLSNSPPGIASPIIPATHRGSAHVPF